MANDSNKVRPEHVAEALDDVRDSMRQYAMSEADTSDADLLDEILGEAKDLLKAEEIGDAETAHTLARHIAGLAVLYMARGIA